MSYVSQIATSLRLYKLSLAVQCFVQSGIMTLLNTRPRTVAEIASLVGLGEEHVGILLRALASSQIVRFDEVIVSLPTGTIDSGVIKDLEALCGYHREAVPRWTQLVEALVNGDDITPQALPLTAYAAGLASVHPDHRPIFSALLQPFDVAPRVLDVGGGSGACAAEVLAARPDAKITIVDPLWYAPDAVRADTRIQHADDIANVIGQSFHLVICVNTLHCLRSSEVSAVLHTVKGLLLHREARFVVQEFVPVEQSPFACGAEYLMLGQLINPGVTVDWFDELDPVFLDHGFDIESTERPDDQYIGHPSRIWILRARSADVVAPKGDSEV